MSDSGTGGREGNLVGGVKTPNQRQLQLRRDLGGGRAKSVPDSHSGKEWNAHTERLMRLDPGLVSTAPVQIDNG